jgi:hypothetical protein
VDEWAVKKYARPSVNLDNVEVMPSEVRPPSVLKHTMDYLIDSILHRRDHGIIEVYNFIRDRSRSIRQDFTYQNITNELYIEIHEQIARFRILTSFIFSSLVIHFIFPEDG